MSARVVVEVPGLGEVPDGAFADLRTAREIVEDRVTALGLTDPASCDLEWWPLSDGSRWSLYDGNRFTGFRIYVEGTES